MRSNHPTPRNVCSSGALVTANAENGVAVFTGCDLRAGDIRSGKVTIANAGSFAGRFRLFEVDASNSFAPGDLTMVIDEIGDERPVAVYRGDIGEVPVDGIELGGFEPGEERAYRFIVVLAIDSPNGGQGRGAGAAYEWDFAPDDRGHR
jgi:spore coat-associated protein N